MRCKGRLFKLQMKKNEFFHKIIWKLFANIKKQYYLSPCKGRGADCPFMGTIHWKQYPPMYVEGPTAANHFSVNSRDLLSPEEGWRTIWQRRSIPPVKCFFCRVFWHIFLLRIPECSCFRLQWSLCIFENIEVALLPAARPSCSNMR